MGCYSYIMGINGKEVSFPEAIKIIAENNYIKWTWRIVIIAAPFVSFVLGTSYTLAQQLNDLPLVVAANSDRITIVEQGLMDLTQTLGGVGAKLDVLIEINQALLTQTIDK